MGSGKAWASKEENRDFEEGLKRDPSFPRGFSLVTHSFLSINTHTALPDPSFSKRRPHFFFFFFIKRKIKIRSRFASRNRAVSSSPLAHQAHLSSQSQGFLCVGTRLSANWIKCKGVWLKYQILPSRVNKIIIFMMDKER